MSDQPQAEPESVRDITTVRVLHAPRELVFCAFRDPQRLAKWWGPNGFTNSFREFDFREGGNWRFTMKGPDGVEYPNENVFVEVTPPERITLKHVSNPQFQLTITLDQPLDKPEERTKIGWRMLFNTAAERDSVKKIVVPTNEQNLDRLEAELAAMAPQENRR